LAAAQVSVVPVILATGNVWRSDTTTASDQSPSLLLSLAAVAPSKNPSMLEYKGAVGYDLHV